MLNIFHPNYNFKILFGISEDQWRIINFQKDLSKVVMNKLKNIKKKET